VCAFAREGTLRWRLDDIETELGDPLLGPDDTLYVLPEGEYRERLLAVSADGVLLWAQVPVPGPSPTRAGTRFVDRRGLSVAPDGWVAVMEEASVSLIRPNGEIAWVVTGTWEAGLDGIPRWSPQLRERQGYGYPPPMRGGSPYGHTTRRRP
jgi:hypothetical protein